METSQWFKSLTISDRMRIAAKYTEATGDNTNIAEGLNEEAEKWLFAQPVKNISFISMAGPHGKPIEVTEDVYDYALNVLPPIKWKGHFFGMGEAYTVGVYYFFTKKHGKYWAVIASYLEAIDAFDKL